MKIYVLVLYYVIAITSPLSVLTKSLSQNSLSARYDRAEESNYPVKRKVQSLNQSPLTEVHEEPPDVEYLDSSSGAEEEAPPSRVRRLETSPYQPLLSKRYDFKRSPNGWLNRHDKLHKRDIKPFNREEPYGIVYSNGKPLGILEPYPQAYEFSPLLGDKEGIEEIQPIPPVTRDSHQPIMDILYRSGRFSVPYQMEGESERGETDLENAAKYTDEKYPSLLADFKIENKKGSNKRQNDHTAKNVDRSETLDDRNSPTKREAALKSKHKITDEKVAELKAALSKIQNSNPSDRVDDIEENLRGILNDMGLIESVDKYDSLKSKRELGKQNNFGKREGDKEDENLEEGSNKIKMVQAVHDSTKNRFKKRDSTKESLSKSKSNTVEDQKDHGLTDSSELKSGLDLPDVREQNVKVTGENQAKSASKRDILKVANYQREGEAYIRSKRQEVKPENTDIMKGLEKSGELTVSGNKSPLATSENEDNIDENHKTKITTSSLTEKVKRSPSEEEYQKQLEQNIQAKIDAIKEQVKREIEDLQTKNAQRQKRDAANTLLEEETNALDPQLHPEEKLIPHVRRRRHLESQSLNRHKRGLPDFSNLQNIDTGDYLDLTGEKPLRNERETKVEYQIDPQEDRLIPDMISNSRSKRDSYFTNKAQTMARRSATLEDNLIGDLQDSSPDDEDSEFIHKRARSAYDEDNRIERDVNEQDINSAGDPNFEDDTDLDEDSQDNIQKREQILEELDNDKLQTKLNMLAEQRRDAAKRNINSHSFENAKISEDLNTLMKHKRNSQERNLEIDLKSPSEGEDNKAINKRSLKLESYFDTGSNTIDKGAGETSAQTSNQKRSPSLENGETSNTNEKTSPLVENNAAPSITEKRSSNAAVLLNNNKKSNENVEEGVSLDNNEKRSPNSNEDSSNTKEKIGSNLDLNSPSGTNEKRSSKLNKDSSSNEAQALEKVASLSSDEKRSPGLNEETSDTNEKEHLQNEAPTNTNEKRSPNLNEESSNNNKDGASVSNAVKRTPNLERGSSTNIDENSPIKIEKLEEKRNLNLKSDALSNLEETVDPILESRTLTKITEKRTPALENAPTSNIGKNSAENLEPEPSNIGEKRNVRSESVTTINLDGCSTTKLIEMPEKSTITTCSTTSSERESLDNKRSVEENSSDDDQTLSEEKRSIIQGTLQTKKDAHMKNQDIMDDDLQFGDRSSKELLSNTKLDDSVRENSIESQTGNQHARKRRHFEDSEPNIIHYRSKRANGIMPDANVAYVPYRADEEETDDEGDEFEDDGFDDRTANMHKREANYERYQNIHDYENNDAPLRKRSIKRKYDTDINSDSYGNPSGRLAEENYVYDNPDDEYVRRKRHNFDDLAAIHGGGPMLHHLAAVRDRSLQGDDNFRAKRTFKHKRNVNMEINNEPQKITDLSDTDLFGALPQSYEGELSRFKRIKRSSTADREKKVR